MTKTITIKTGAYSQDYFLQTLGNNSTNMTVPQIIMASGNLTLSQAKFTDVNATKFALLSITRSLSRLNTSILTSTDLEQLSTVIINSVSSTVGN
jgi:hypothetical protein